MFETFKSYIRQKLLLSNNDRILLAVSGGGDSAAMLDLFAHAGYHIAIAHCNFHLRGDDSNLDEAFVADLADKYKVDYFKIDFDTYAYAQEKGISIEMAARELRYNWFEKIRSEHNYDYIATAHHSDDVIETFFLNLVRGTGIRGLSGIKAKTGKIIRPILFARRNQITEYLHQHKLMYRKDKSNEDIRFKRNKIRHDIIPQFEDIHPAYKDNILKTIELLDTTKNILTEKIDELREQIVSKKGIYLFFDLKKLLKLKQINFYLFEFLYPYAYNYSQITDIVKSLNGISGKVFYSNNYQLVKDREFLILSPRDIQSEQLPVYLYENQNSLIIRPLIRLKIENKSIIGDFKIPNDHKIAVLDKKKLKFPLLIRRWEYGDYFYPLGMNKKKKLSDFFIDNKISAIEKQNILVLLSGDDIVWIIGYRIDNRYKLNTNTENIIQIIVDFN